MPLGISSAALQHMIHHVAQKRRGTHYGLLSEEIWYRSPMQSSGGAQESYLGDRYEFKYLLSAAQAQRIQAYVETLGLPIDDRSKDGAYIVNSLYFETPFLDDYRDKDASLVRRKKVRARMYREHWSDPGETVWLEIKNKVDFRIHKERMGISRAQWQTFIESENPLTLRKHAIRAKDQHFVERFSYLFMKRCYQPHVVVSYRRTAHLDYTTSPIRITFDFDITTRFASEDEGTFVPVFPHHVVMEIKFAKVLPWWFTRMVEMYDLKRTDFSKYNHSVARLRNYYRIPIHR